MEKKLLLNPLKKLIFAWIFEYYNIYLCDFLCNFSSIASILYFSLSLSLSSFPLSQVIKNYYSLPQQRVRHLLTTSKSHSSSPNLSPSLSSLCIVNFIEPEHRCRMCRTVEYHFSSGLSAKLWNNLVVNLQRRRIGVRGAHPSNLVLCRSRPQPFLPFPLETMRTKVYGRARLSGESYIFAAMLVNCGHAASRHIVGGPSGGSKATLVCVWPEGLRGSAPLCQRVTG